MTLRAAALGLALGACCPAVAAAQPPWHRYVLGTGASDLPPLAVAQTTGAVTDAPALVRGSGAATLSWDGSGEPPAILLDYGREVGSVPHFSVARVAAPPGAATVTLRAAYSEARKFMTDTGDTSENLVRRYEDFPLTRPGEVTSQTLQGGFRFQRISLTSPGTVALARAGARVEFENAAPEDYEGWFLSSDDRLNRIWYAGAYTVQTNMAPPGTQYANASPWLLDGAKRDRAVWSGDVYVQGASAYVSLGLRAGPYARGSLKSLAAWQQPDGAMPGAVGLFGPLGVYYSLPYSIYSALALVDYVRYTGDLAFAREQYTALKRQMQYDADQVDPQTGLLTAGAGPGQGSPVFGEGNDWDVYDGAKTGAVTAFNVLYQRALTEAAWLARHLEATGDAGAWAADAARLRARINAALYDRARSAYRLATADVGTHPAQTVAEDANSQAILFGVAEPATRAAILRTLQARLWTDAGALPFSRDSGFSTNLSPFATGYEVRARFAAGDARGALALTHRTWDRMVDPAGPYYTGTFWEKMLADGSVEDSPTATAKPGFISLAHGWATTPTAALSEYVLGVEPVEPGFARWTVRPEPGGLRWAQGQVPTPHGPIRVQWRQGTGFTIRVDVPDATSGRIAVPAGARSVVRVNGKRTVLRPAGGRAVLEAAGPGSYRITVRPRESARSSG